MKRNAELRDAGHRIIRHFNGSELEVDIRRMTELLK